MIAMSPTRLALDIVRQVNKYALNPVMLRLMRMRSFLRLTKAPATAGTAASVQEPHAPAVKPDHKRTTAPRTRRATGSAPRAHRAVATDPGHPDLRQGDPRVHDLIAEIDEAIDAGDEPLVEQLSNRLAQLAPNTGAGADT